MTSSTAELLSRVRAAGGRLVADGVNLKVKAPAALPADLVAEIRAHRWEILDTRGQIEQLTAPSIRGCAVCGSATYLVHRGERYCARCAGLERN